MRAIAKPVDLGSGAVCASFGSDGRWLSLATVHPARGYVELMALPAFDEARRGDPAATRRYREAMTEDRWAFLVLEADGPMATAVDVTDPHRPRWRGQGLAAEAWTTPDARTIGQRWHLARPGRLRFGGRLALPALAEVTELAPEAPSEVTTRLAADGGRLVVDSPDLPAAALVEVDRGQWVVDGEAAWLAVAPGRLEVRCSIVPSLWAGAAWSPGAPAPSRRQAGRRADGRSDAVAAPSVLHVGRHLRRPLARLAERAVAYVRGCTGLLVAPGERVFLADHRILPLSWTRDAYYQARALLATGEAEDAERVADHLRWLWRRCHRPDGRWVRSHHADGRPKDLAFQADQQLYPLLELADHARATGGLPDGVDWSVAVGEAWDALLADSDPATGMVRSAETAADDPALAPYITATEILGWYTARRLAELVEDGLLGVPLQPLRSAAERFRDAVRHVQATADSSWAYATDGAGGAVRYHDANDLPIALAPLWGFCAADDPQWRATVRFAFSGANPACVDVRGAARLGSIHSPGPWTLGDLQAWVIASLEGRAADADLALERLLEAAFEDGMLPETWDSGRPLRHWFAWPGAALAAILLLDARGRLSAQLAARPDARG